MLTTNNFNISNKKIIKKNIMIKNNINKEIRSIIENLIKK